MVQKFGAVEKTTGYIWKLPQPGTELYVALAIMIFGFVCIWVMEKAAAKKEETHGE